MKRIVLIILSVLLFLALIFLVFKTQENRTGINKSIKFAIGYIYDNTLEKGRFVYRTNVDPKISYCKLKYNCTRHAGVLYSMYLCERYLKNYLLQEKRYIASEYFIKRYISQITPDMYAVVAKINEEKSEFPEANLGSTGLALCSLSNLYPEGKIDLKTLQGLGNFIIYMQKTDGSFYSKYIVPNKLRSDKFVSKYYPGEAALGLLFLNEVNPDKKWVEASKKALLYIANSVKNKKNAGFDHWAILAVKKLFETPDNGLSDDEKLLLQTSVEKMTVAILDKQITDKKSPYRGSFIKNNRLASVATIMEGLTAAYYVTNDRKLKAEIKKALKLGTGFLSRYQVKEGPRQGGIPANASWNSPDADNKDKIIRIDNVQHALSAWILYKQIGLSK